MLLHHKPKAQKEIMYRVKIKIVVCMLFSKGKKASLAKKKQENCRTDAVENRSQKYKSDGLSQYRISIAKKSREQEKKGGRCRFLFRISIGQTLPLLGNTKAKQCQIGAKAVIKGRIFIEIGKIQTEIYEKQKQQRENSEGAIGKV